MENHLGKSEVTELLNNLPGMLYRCKYDHDWTMEFISDGCKELTGYDHDELLFNNKISYAKIMHQDDILWTFDIVTQALKDKKPFTYEYRIVTKDGIEKWVWEQGLGIYDRDDKILYIEGYIADITYQMSQNDKLKKELEKKNHELVINSSLLNEYKKAVDESAIVTKTDPNGIITYVNDEFCRVSGFSREEVIGKSHNIIRHPQNPNTLFEEFWNVILAKKTWKGIVKNRNKALKTYYVKSVVVPILDLDGEIKEFLAIRHDVTDLIHQGRRLKFQTTDHMTHLPNRQKLIEDLEENDKLKLAVINIEKFKEINEYYGFDIGDRLLIEVSFVLKKKLNRYPEIKLYKLPGDEFAVLANENMKKEKFRNLVVKILQKIKSFQFKIGEYNFNISAIAGASMQKDYLINAEMATNHARKSTEDCIFFDDNLDIREKIVNNINWTHKLKDAIRDDRIVIFAQPIYSNKTNTINKYECLVRMLNVDKTVVPPMQFLNVAKKARLYPELTKIVIEKSTEFFKDKDVEFSINFTLEDIQNKEVVDCLINKIKQYKNLGDRLVIEIVEDEGIENYDEVSAFIENVKSMGCKIAIDDFGTGYSNFDYLMKLNVDFIKIDGSIIKNIPHDYNAKVVTELIVDFAKRLNIETIGEFVFNEEVLNTVKKMGVDYSQGFYLGKPEPI